METTHRLAACRSLQFQLHMYICRSNLVILKLTTKMCEGFFHSTSHSIYHFVFCIDSVCLLIVCSCKMPKRRDLSFQENCDMLKAYDTLKKNVRDATGQLNISRCTLGRILKDRSSIRRASLENMCYSKRKVNRKRRNCGGCIERMVLKSQGEGCSTRRTAVKNIGTV